MKSNESFHNVSHSGVIILLHMINFTEFTRTLYCCMIPGCEKAYSSCSNLKLHVETIHQNKKNYQCSECMRRFACKQNLVEHIYIHKGERPFECTICGQAFRQATQLSLHRRKHDVQNEDEIIDKIQQRLSDLRQRKNNKGKVRNLNEILALGEDEELLDVDLPPLRKAAQTID
jgi:uncharacterized Zn-finger protein